jgi:GntR family transcriptional regulator
MEIDKTVRNSDEASPITFRLDASSGVPTYLQIVQQVERALRLGYLVSGDRLPKVREVVAALAINPNTVLKAYRELEHEGVAEGRRGVGTFVREQAAPLPADEVKELRGSLQRWVNRARASGLDDEGMAALFSDVVRPPAVRVA